jgi:L-amino acid N-acyltransferase YncA
LVIKASKEDIDKLKIATGFARWIATHDDKGKEELKQLLKSRLDEGMEVWLAVDGDEVVGFTIVGSWPALPGAKTIEAVEVAKQLRGRGIGSAMIRRIMSEHAAPIALTLSPEEGYESGLEKFYEDLGFRRLTEDYMVRIPEVAEGGSKLRKWMEVVGELLEVYQALLKEMKTRYDEAYRRSLEAIRERRGAEQKPS